MSQKEYAAAKASLMAKLQPMADSLTDTAQKVAFVIAMGPPKGPKPIPHQGAGLSWEDFGVPTSTYQQYAQLPYDPKTGTFGGDPPGPGAIPVDQFNALVAKGQATTA